MRAMSLMLLCSALLSAQNAKTTGTVAPSLAEFKIPLQQPANAVWNWNRTETADNEGEYSWQVAVRGDGGRYTFGFFLYKFPGAKPAHGDLQALLNAGQASVFKEDTQGDGELLEKATIHVSTENDKIVIRIADADLIRTIFASRPATATINTRAIGSSFEVVTIEYRN